MKNGRGGDHDDDPKIASFETARKRADAAKKAAARSARPERTIAQWMTGALIVAMALGMIVWWGRSLMQSWGFAP